LKTRAFFKTHLLFGEKAGMIFAYGGLKEFGSSLPKGALLNRDTARIRCTLVRKTIAEGSRTNKSSGEAVLR